MTGRNITAGFTVIEAMVILVILGSLAAIAVPAFQSYVRRSKTSEVPSNLRTMYLGAATYTDMEHWHEGPSKGMTDVVSRGVMWGFSQEVRCHLQSSNRIPAVPMSNKQVGSFLVDDTFREIGFTVPDPVYYAYQLQARGGMGDPATCMLTEGPLYTFLAVGDLDGDGALSRFELSAGLNSSLILYRSPGIYSVQELE